MAGHSIKSGHLLIACAILITGCDSAAQPEDDGWFYTPDETPLDAVPAARLENLTKGINTSHWFAQSELTPQRFLYFVTRDDIRLIKQMGFRHIRMPLDPNVLLLGNRPETLSASRIDYFSDAVSMILEEGLAVIVELHPESSFKERLENDPEFVETIARFWNALAYHLHSHDPDRVFLEVINEPEFEVATKWQDVQARLVEAMRAGAPRHTIIATGPNWSSTVELVKIEPLADPNVVYNFHLYEPHTFTHQGATWGWYAWEYFHDLPYPSSPEAVSEVAKNIDATVREHVLYYGVERWNRDRLESLIAPVVDWAERHGANLTCNEFGVYRLVAPPEDRLRWLRDVRELLESYEIGWAMWDYAAGFGVVNDGAAGREPDPGTQAALGLAP